MTHPSDFNPTPDGFISTLTPPKWFNDTPPDLYTINARVPNADIAAWKNQSNHHELLRLAMQDLLKDRCKLVVHGLPTDLPDYKLVIGKKGLKELKATPPGFVLPTVGPPTGGISPLPTGGVRTGEKRDGLTTWHYYGATIKDLVDFLSLSARERPIHDETGLTGRYNFTLQMVDSTHDPGDSTANWPITPLGLQLKPGRHPGFKLVIDNFEKPTQN